MQFNFTWLKQAHCPAPFVEHFRNKKNYYKSTKQKDGMMFSHVVSFCNTGLDSSVLNVGKNMLEKKYKGNKRVRDKYFVLLNKTQSINK